ncbi:Rad4-domain-containing protein, partial [Cutaneotrichosporon oleaginosum]
DSDDEGGERVIRLEIGGETEEEKAKRIALAMRKKPMTAKDRAIRLEIHKMHVIALLASTRIRNKWASDELLQCRLLSLCPLRLAADLVVSPKRFPDRAQRNRLFLEALQELVTWWSQDFFDISDPMLGLRTRTWDDMQEIIERMPRLSRAELLGGVLSRRTEAPRTETPKSKKGKGKDKNKMEDPVLAALEEELGGERLRSVNSLAKKALQQEGSRDVSALLFVALARACGLGARLVVNIQAVPWRAEKVVAKKKGAGSGARSAAQRQGMGDDYSGSEEDELEEVQIPGASGAEPSRKNNSNLGSARQPSKPRDSADMYRLRQPKPPPQTVGSKPKRKKQEDMMAQPPVFWAEVYNRSDQRWVPVDPVNGIIRKKAHYEPQSDSGPVRLAYILTTDGYARDVTLRYARNFAAKTCKLRPPVKSGEPDWWPEIVTFLQRPLRLNRDDLEDAELENSQASEGMPQHMSGFKDHPIYVLERHLKQHEVIQPKREVGRFKGEPVYRRANVLACRTAENWMRVGRRVKDRQEPMKWIKQRAVTIQKRRAQELALQETGEAIQQGLYAENQTELYIPPPIVDGKIPQNAFGNIDLYVPTMLPAGAVHLPYKGIAKVAKKMGVSFAEAVTSFEFRKQRATPVLTGIVVAAEKEEEVLAAYWESNAAAEERERTKREERALKRWVKLINGIRVRLRLRAEYGEIDDVGS